MQRNRGAQGPSSKPQGISLDSPMCPIQGFQQTKRKKFRPALPLQRLDLPRLSSSQGSSERAFIRRNANRMESAFEHLDKRGLARARQPAHHTMISLGPAPDFSTSRWCPMVP